MQPDWAAIADTTRRGFTFHEMLDNIGLIHMNGRVYDPAIGRFLSVDPYIPSLADSQSVNPYSYVGNRPLSFTDPTGFNHNDPHGGGRRYGNPAICGPGPCGIGNVYITIGRPSYGFGRLARNIGRFFSDLFGSDPPPPPPAKTFPGTSAQNGVNICDPGMSSPSCAGGLSLTGDYSAVDPSTNSGPDSAVGNGAAAEATLDGKVPVIFADDIRYGKQPIWVTPDVRDQVEASKRQVASAVLLAATVFGTGELLPVWILGRAPGAASNVLVNATARGVLNPKLYAEAERILARHGARSIHKALKSARETLAEHEAKLQQILKEGGFPSAVQTTIRNVRDQIVTLEKFIKDFGL